MNLPGLGGEVGGLLASLGRLGTRRGPRTKATSKKESEEPVANIKSQIKRNRQNERRRLANKAVRSEMKTRTKNAVAAAEAGADNSVEALRLAVKRIDKAAASGTIHKNQAANRKSRLMKRINALSSK